MPDVWGREYADEKALRLIKELAPKIDEKKLKEILDNFQESIEDSTQRAIYWSV